MTTAELNLAETSEEAERRALQYFETDPYEDIRPSLLSATEIVQYVERTGMIFPFDPSPEHLKHASYEGRIGKKAFSYNIEGERIQISMANGFLELPHDSIVFVECDLRFRLPRYIAVRFNLHIKHVHRGLLLGTGPLVDPGFNGKLLIPIHNLTSEDYHIPVSEGLIWVEFTKTTYNQNIGHKYGEFPKRKNIAEVEEWLDRIEISPKTGERVPIRSSVPLLVRGANEQASQALQTAGDAAAVAKRVETNFWRFGLWGAAAVVLTLLALIGTFGITIYQQNSAHDAFVQAAYSELGALRSKQDQQASAIADLRQSLTNIADSLENVKNWPAPWAQRPSR